jgi:uncharacterized protein YjbJ (UPF0337 family)
MEIRGKTKQIVGKAQEKIGKARGDAIKEAKFLDRERMTS